MLIPTRPARVLIAALLLTLTGVMSADGATGSISYTYDMLGRVTTALYDNGACIAYAYDANGNRTSVTITVSGSPVSPVWGTGVWGCFSWTP